MEIVRSYKRLRGTYLRSILNMEASMEELRGFPDFVCRGRQRDVISGEENSDGSKEPGMNCYVRVSGIKDVGR